MAYTENDRRLEDLVRSALGTVRDLPASGVPKCRAKRITEATGLAPCAYVFRVGRRVVYVGSTIRPPVRLRMHFASGVVARGVTSIHMLGAASEEAAKFLESMLTARYFMRRHPLRNKVIPNPDAFDLIQLTGHPGWPLKRAPNAREEEMGALRAMQRKSRDRIEAAFQ